MMRTLIIGSGVNQVKEIKESCYVTDISQEYLDEAKKLRPNNKYILANAEKLPFKKNFFDKIIFTHVLEHVNRPKKAISEIHRVLKRGGKLFLEVPAHERESFLAKNNGVFKRDVYEGHHKNRYNQQDLEKQLSKFREVKIKTIGGRDIVFWFLWGKFIHFFRSKDQYYIEECGQIHSKKFDFLTRQLSRLFFITNIILSPFIFRRMDGEYHAIAIK